MTQLIQWHSGCYVMSQSQKNLNLHKININKHHESSYNHTHCRSHFMDWFSA